MTKERLSRDKVHVSALVDNKIGGNRQMDNSLPKYPQVNARVSPELKRWIQRRAEEEHRSQSSLVRKILEERREREGDPQLA